MRLLLSVHGIDRATLGT